MARSIRDYTRSKRVNALSEIAETFFGRLMCKADDFGNFYGDPVLLKSELWPRKTDKERPQELVESCLNECEKVGLIKVYEADGQQYLHIFEFGQRLRSMKSRFPQSDSIDRIDFNKSAVNCQQLSAVRRDQPPELELEEKRTRSRTRREEEVKMAAVRRPWPGDEFEAAWQKWVKYRASIRKPYRTGEQVAKQFEWFLHHANDPQQAIRIMDQSIVNGWQGLFEERSGSLLRATEQRHDGYDQNRTEITRRAGLK